MSNWGVCLLSSKLGVDGETSRCSSLNTGETLPGSEGTEDERFLLVCLAEERERAVEGGESRLRSIPSCGSGWDGDGLTGSGGTLVSKEMSDSKVIVIGVTSSSSMI
jgi:hypothetical protein